MSETETPQKIPPIPIQTAIDLASSQLASSVHVSNAFNSVLVDPSESRFIASKGLLNTNHTRWHTQAVIALNKTFKIFSGLYWLDFLAPPVLTTTAMDEIALRYLRLLLEQADDFHQTYMEYKICRLDLIIGQAAN